MAAMMGQGSGGGDVFAMRDMFLKERKKLDDRRKAAEGPSPMQVCAEHAPWVFVVSAFPRRRRVFVLATWPCDCVLF